MPVTLGLCPVPPDGYGSDQWVRDREPLLKAAAKRDPENPERWADDYLRHHADEADLRALGYCRGCGSPGALRQVGRCVYWSSCDHYRAQGDLRKMQPYLDARRRKMSPERRAALLAMVGVVE